MTSEDLNRKVSAAIEGASGRLAVIVLLGIIATTSGWMLKTELDQATQLTALSRDLVNLQAIQLGQTTRAEAEVGDIHHALTNINDTIVQLEVRFGALDQRLSDIMIPMAPREGGRH